MATKTIGRGVAAMKVSPLGAGCMSMTAFYGEAPAEEQSMEVLRAAYDLGVRHFDTAQIYQRKLADGKILYNEELVGKFLATLSKDERKDVTVATKFNPYYGGGDKFNEKEFVEATKMSCKRLGVKCIDLYYFHRIYAESAVPVATWMGAAKKLINQGLIKRIGLSEASADIIRKANAIHPITCIQQEWSLFARDLEVDIVPTCRELGIGIIAYSPIGRGILAGGFNRDDGPTDWRSTVPYLSKENIAHNLEIIDQIKAMAAEKGHTVGQLCLAWLIKQGAVPIPGTTKLHHLEDNMGALEVNLSDEEMKTLGDLGNQVIGERGDKGYMSKTFQHLQKSKV